MKQKNKFKFITFTVTTLTTESVINCSQCLDKNPGDEAAALKYSEITNAYEILSDVEKRSVYDLDGMKGLKEREQGGGRGMNPFDMFFGGGGRQQNKAPSSRFNVGVTLQDLYNGARRDAT